jgi:hypothetical protein
MKVIFLISIFFAFTASGQLLPSGDCFVTFSLNKSKALTKQMDSEDSSSYIEALDRIFSDFDVEGAYITFDPDSMRAYKYIDDYTSQNATIVDITEILRFKLIDIDDIFLQFSLDNYELNWIHVTFHIKKCAIQVNLYVKDFKNQNTIYSFIGNIEEYIHKNEIIQIQQSVSNYFNSYDSKQFIEKIDFLKFNSAISEKVNNCKRKNWIITESEQYELFEEMRNETPIEKLAEAIDKKHLLLFEYCKNNIFEDYGIGEMRIYEPQNRKALFTKEHLSAIALSDSMGEPIKQMIELDFEVDYTGTSIILPIDKEELIELEIIEFNKANNEKDIYVRFGFDSWVYPKLSFFVNLKDVKKIFGEKSIIVHTILNCQQFGLQYAQVN